MDLREPVSPRLLLVGLAGVAAFSVVAFLAPSRLVVPICVLVSCVLTAFLLLRAWFIAYLRRAFVQAVRAEDPATARSLSERLLKVSRLPAWRSQWTMAGGSLLALEERYAESRAILEKIDREHLSALAKVALDNDIAWALAHDGAPAEAVAFAERAIAALPKSAPAELSSSCVGTLGVAQLKADHAAEARAALDALGSKLPYRG